MAGRIKSGEGTLIGNAGEYYVVAELLKRGVNAALAARNAPDFDVLATREGRTVRIRVKTKSEQYKEYQWSINKQGAIFRHIGETDDFVVMVNLAEETAKIDFHVVPTPVIDKWLRDTFQKWVSTPGPRKPVRNAENKKRHLNSVHYAELLAPYRNAWSILWKRP